jgi:hypothetical protein
VAVTPCRQSRVARRVAIGCDTSPRLNDTRPCSARATPPLGALAVAVQRRARTTRRAPIKTHISAHVRSLLLDTERRLCARGACRDGRCYVRAPNRARRQPRLRRAGPQRRATERPGVVSSACRRARPAAGREHGAGCAPAGARGCVSNRSGGCSVTASPSTPAATGSSASTRNDVAVHSRKPRNDCTRSAFISPPSIAARQTRQPVSAGQLGAADECSTRIVTSNRLGEYNPSIRARRSRIQPSRRS